MNPRSPNEFRISWSVLGIFYFMPPLHDRPWPLKFLRSKGVSIIAEINTKLMRMGCTYCEVPGYFQTGTKPSKLVSFRNILAAALSYLRLILEVHLWKRSTYNKTSRRIFVNLAGPVTREKVDAPDRASTNIRKTAGGD